MNNNELTHHGVKGQQWGIRQYQKRTTPYTSDSTKLKSAVVSHLASKGKILATSALTGIGGKLAFQAAGTAVSLSTGKKYAGNFIKSFGNAALIASAAVATVKLFKKDEEK